MYTLPQSPQLAVSYRDSFFLVLASLCRLLITRHWHLSVYFGITVKRPMLQHDASCCTTITPNPRLSLSEWNWRFAGLADHGFTPNTEHTSLMTEPAAREEYSGVW
ncbi:hypothetical protein RhiJN_27757 [Ceratobasidium sp. AG-Ba]|nr:hypothetical protein RhiJN_27757 [Ceratobasidium sp. AG-Ba]